MYIDTGILVKSIFDMTCLVDLNHLSWTAAAGITSSMPNLLLRALSCLVAVRISRQPPSLPPSAIS